MRQLGRDWHTWQGGTLLSRQQHTGSKIAALAPVELDVVRDLLQLLVAREKRNCAANELYADRRIYLRANSERGG